VRDEHLDILDAPALLCVHWLLCQLSVRSRQNEQDNNAQAATPAKPSRRLARKGTGARGVMDRQKPDPVHYDMSRLSMHSGIEVSGSGVRRTIGDGPQQEQQVNEERRRSEATKQLMGRQAPVRLFEKECARLTKHTGTIFLASTRLARMTRAPIPRQQNSQRRHKKPVAGRSSLVLRRGEQASG